MNSRCIVPLISETSWDFCAVSLQYDTFQGNHAQTYTLPLANIWLMLAADYCHLILLIQYLPATHTQRYFSLEPSASKAEP